MLPARISFTEAWALRPADAPPGWALAGVGGDQLAAHGPDLATGVPAFVVGGPAGSGRSTVLLTLAGSRRGGTEVVVVAPRPSPLRGLAGTARVLAVFDGAGLAARPFAEALASAPGRPSCWWTTPNSCGTAKPRAASPRSCAASQVRTSPWCSAETLTALRRVLRLARGGEEAGAACC